MRSFLFLWLAGLAFGGEGFVVESVEVKGADLHVALETQVGQPYDEAAVQRDVRHLWGLGRFDDVRAEVSGAAVRFVVASKPRYRVREIRFTPHSYGLQPAAPAGAMLDDLEAHRIAADAEKQLQLQGYRNARVRHQFLPPATLLLTIDAGEAVRVKQVEIDGDPHLRNALVALRPKRIIPGVWRMLPDYSPEAVDGDVNRLRSWYLARGFFDASVSADEAVIRGRDAFVRIHANPGPRFEVHGTDLTKLCPCLLAARREAERQGILDFNTTLHVHRAGDAAANVTTEVERGAPFRVRRIGFYGLHRLSDTTARRNMLLDETAPLDQYLLRKSVARMMQTRLFDDFQARDVAIVRDEAHHVADIKIRLRERKLGAWNVAGPVGPASIAGPVRAAILSRVPWWATYTVSIGMVAWQQTLIPALAVKRFVPIFALTRGFLPGDSWRTGFSIVPQLGWQGSLIATGTAQLQGRVLPVLSPNPGLTPELVAGVDGDVNGSILCDAPKPKMRVLRTVASLAVRLPGAMAGF